MCLATNDKYAWYFKPFGLSINGLVSLIMDSWAGTVCSG